MEATRARTSFPSRGRTGPNLGPDRQNQNGSGGRERVAISVVDTWYAGLGFILTPIHEGTQSSSKGESDDDAIGFRDA